MRQSYSSAHCLNLSSTASQYLKLRKFLSELDPEARHSTIRDKLTEGTGKWLLDSEKFQRWKDGSGPRVFCLLGEPGKGKSSLLCHIVERLRSEEKTRRAVVMSVYCDYSDQRRHTAHNILGALLSQIITHLDRQTDVIKELDERHKHDRSLATDQCRAFLRKAAKAGRFKTVWLCLDALDELVIEERDKLLREISLICQDWVFRVCLTGRSNSGVDNSINHFICASSTPADVEYIVLSGEEMSQDIRRFLEQKLSEDANPSLLDDKLRVAIFHHLAGYESTFLLAALNIGKVLQGKTINRREAALNQLTLNLDSYYDETVARVKKQDEEYGMRILHWILFAVRPLTLKELRYAIAIQPGLKSLDPQRDLPPPSILNSTLGLVTLEREDPFSYHPVIIARFVHMSFQEYLLRNPSRYFPAGHALLAEATLDFLSLSAMDTEEGRKRYHDKMDLEPFTQYATDYWGQHARQKEDEKIVERVCCFLASENITLFRHIVDPNDPFNWYASPSHALAYFGLSASLTRLLSSNPRIEDVLNLRDENGATPLAVALWERNPKFAEQLLELKEVDANCPGWTPLVIAARRGYSKIVSILLDRKDIDVNLADKFGCSPLCAAVDNGHVETARQLLARSDVDVNSAHRFGWTPLRVAVDRNDVHIVQHLLEREDANVNFAGTWRETPLYLAVEKGYIGSIKRLLRRKDVDVNFADYWLQTPLIIAVDNGYVNILKCLLERNDVNVNLADYAHRTPLLLAVQKGRIDMVNSLLEKGGIDVNLAGRDGRTALEVAIGDDHLDIAKKLSEREEACQIHDRRGRIVGNENRVID